jgi:hypothetical protein
LTKAILVAIAILLSPVVALAHGTMRGCVTDKSGAVLPGVDIVLSNAAGERKVTTDASGCYELKGLPAGIYTVGARLAGFVTGMHEGVKVEDGGPPAHVDFSLCLGGLAEIDWVVWPRLGEAWQKADAVVHVRVTATGPVNSECPNSNFQHTAAVVEILKDDAKRPIGSTVIFVQDKWVADALPGWAGVGRLSERGEGFLLAVVRSLLDVPDRRRRGHELSLAARDRGHGARPVAGYSARRWQGALTLEPIPAAC